MRITPHKIPFLKMGKFLNRQIDRRRLQSFRIGNYTQIGKFPLKGFNHFDGFIFAHPVYNSNTGGRIAVLSETADALLDMLFFIEGRNNDERILYRR